MRDRESHFKNKANVYRLLPAFIICMVLFGTNVFGLSGTKAEVGSRETEEMTEEPGFMENTAESEESQNQKAIGITARNGISRAGVETVTTWEGFVAALADTSVSVIDVQANLTRPGTATSYNPGTIARDLTIIGNGNTINFGSGGTTSNGIILGAPSGSVNLTLSDVYLVKTQTPATPVFNQASAAASSNWNIVLQNVRSGTGNTAGLITAGNASVTVYGTENQLSLNASAYHFYIKNFEMAEGAALSLASAGAANAALCITGGELHIRKNAILDIDNNGTSGGEADTTTTYSSGIFGAITAMTMEEGSLLDVYANVGVAYRTYVDTVMTMTGGAVMNVTSRTQTALGLTGDYGSSPSTTSIVTVSGVGTQINVDSSSTRTANDGAAMRVGGNNCVFTLKDGAEINAHHTVNSCIQFLGTGNVFNVSNGAKINAVQDGGTYNLGATLRFRYTGGQTFNIDNAEVNLLKLGGDAPAVRLFGGNNAINVTNGGKFEVRNYGTGTAQNGTSDNHNQGILYASTSSGESNSFYVDGYKSEIDIQADSGPAIYAEGSSGSSTTISAANGAIFKLSGITSSYNYGTIGCAGPVNITLDNPLYFDIRNNRVGSGSTRGGYCLSSGNASSTFTTINSDLSVWSRGSNLNGDPTKTWSLFDYTLSGRYFDTISYTNVPEEFNVSTYGSTGAQGYSRMSANNAAAVVDELRVPTNADKYIYGHAYVPEGADGQRDAWTDEVYVTVQVKNADGSIAYTAQGTTVGAASDDSNNGLSVYGEPERAGIIVIAVPDGAYMETGQTVEVTGAWRGSADSNSGRVHTSTADDLKADLVTVRDVTPPQALTIANLDNVDTSQISIKTKVISGTSDEIGETIYLYKNNVLWTDSTGTPVTGTVGTDGTWSITLPGTLSENDKIGIALNDHQVNPTDLTQSDLDKLTNAGVFANNGNENPAKVLVFHDATFIQRLELTAVWTELCPIVLDVSDNSLTNAKGDRVTTGIVISGNTITVNPEAFDLCTSSHMHELIVIGQAENKTVFLVGGSAQAYNVYVNGVTVKQMTIQNAGTVTFGADETVTDSVFKNTTDHALVISSGITQVTIQEGSSVTAYANAGIEPISIESGKVKILDLIMNATSTYTLPLDIAGEKRTLPASTARIAVMDNLNGSWLSGKILVKDPDNGKQYVRGTSAQDFAGQWDNDEDSDYSDQNHYGNTFALDKESNTKGIYQAVRLPVAEKYLSVSVPVRVRFGMQLDGEAGNRGNTSWNTVPQSVSNSSYSYEDVSLDSGKRFNKKTNAAKFYYNGLNVSAQEKTENDYTLKSYSTVQPVADATGVNKPLLALLGNTSVSGSADVELDEDEVLTTPVAWFTMPQGTIANGSTDVTASMAQIYLSRPENAGTAVNDYYQYPTDRSVSLSGVHHLKLIVAYVE